MGVSQRAFMEAIDGSDIAPFDFHRHNRLANVPTGSRVSRVLGWLRRRSDQLAPAEYTVPKENRPSILITLNQVTFETPPEGQDDVSLAIARMRGELAQATEQIENKWEA